MHARIRPIEKDYADMGRGPLRLCSEPPYTGGNPDVVNKVNPGIEESRFDLWRNLRALYTRIEVALE